MERLLLRSDVLCLIDKEPSREGQPRKKQKLLARMNYDPVEFFTNDPLADEGPLPSIRRIWSAAIGPVQAALHLAEEERSFFLAFATPQQQATYQQRGTSGIYVDATHNADM